MYWDSGTSAPPLLLVSGHRVSRRRLIAAGVVGALVIMGAVIGHAIARSDSITLGDCVITGPHLATGWDMRKAACASNPGAGLVIQKVVSIQSGANGRCDLGLATLQDVPAGKTYCLTGTAPGG